MENNAIAERLAQMERAMAKAKAALAKYEPTPTIKVPILVQMVIEVSHEANERWMAGTDRIDELVEREITGKIQYGIPTKVIVLGVSQVKIIDSGALNVIL